MVPEVVKFREEPLDPDEAKFQVSRTILSHAVHKGEGVLASNAMNDPRFASGDSVQRLHIRSAICSPIRFRDRTFAQIYIDSSIANYTFTPERLGQVMNAIGQHAGLALSNADLYLHNLQAERLAAIGETVAGHLTPSRTCCRGCGAGRTSWRWGSPRTTSSSHAAAGRSSNLSRIISLTMNMLAFSRQRRVEVELVRLGPIIDECVQLLETACQAKQVAILTDVDAEMPPVPVDSPLIHQLLMNLLSNAVEAVEPGLGAVT